MTLSRCSPSHPRRYASNWEFRPCSPVHLLLQLSHSDKSEASRAVSSMTTNRTPLPSRSAMHCRTFSPRDSPEFLHGLARPRDHRVADVPPVEIRRLQRRGRKNLHRSMGSQHADKWYAPGGNNRTWSGRETPGQHRVRTTPHSDSAAEIVRDFHVEMRPPCLPAARPRGLPGFELLVVRRTWQPGRLPAVAARSLPEGHALPIRVDGFRR